MSEIIEPAVIISDVHLSATRDWRGQLEAMRNLWQGAATIVFNGDTLNQSLCHDRHVRDEIIGTIESLCRDDGVRPVMLSGNSDFQIEGPRHLLLEAGRVIVLHGEVIFPRMSPWRDDAELVASIREQVMREMDASQRDTLDAILASATEALRRSQARIADRRVDLSLWKYMSWWTRWLRRPGSAWAVLDAWRRMPALAAEFCRRHAAGAEVIVFGHAHRRGLWRVDGRTVINTGCFEGSGRPSMVTVDNGRVIVQLVLRRNGAHMPGRTLAEITLRPKMASPL